MLFRNPSNFFTKKEKDFFKFLTKTMKKCDNTYPKQLYLYGGYIRDKIIKRNSKDMDLMISENILDEFIEKLKDNFDYLDCRHHILDEFPKKGYNLYSIKFEKPVLNLGIVEMKKDIFEELKDKDFRMNSLSYNLADEKFFSDRNSHLCLEDIHRRIIKCNFKPKNTFFFSPSRIFRLLRFYISLNFKIDKRICKYLRYQNTFDTKNFFNQSVWSQIRKLVKVMKLYPEKVYKVFKYLYAFKLLIKFQIYADFVKKRIVFLMVEIENASCRDIFELIEIKQLLYQEDFLTINMDVRTLTKIFFLLIAARDSNSRYVKISESI